jgi:SAM-dependent methyltransferase
VNLYHRRYCCSQDWAKLLESSVLPWALRDVELGDNLLEIGPGPGLTTDLLRQRVEGMTAIEIEQGPAAALAKRLAGTNVTVVEGDASAMPFEAATFSGAVSFTMLHHVPSAALQDRLLADVARVLKPGATFAGSDSMASFKFRLYHLFDTMVLVDPEGFAARLERAGFRDIAVRTGKGAFKWRAVRA